MFGYFNVDLKAIKIRPNRVLCHEIKYVLVVMMHIDLTLAINKSQLNKML